MSEAATELDATRRVMSEQPSMAKDRKSGRCWLCEGAAELLELLAAGP